jgi:hypothetical protein
MDKFLLIPTKGFTQELRIGIIDCGERRINNILRFHRQTNRSDSVQTFFFAFKPILDVEGVCFAMCCSSAIFQHLIVLNFIQSKLMS